MPKIKSTNFKISGKQGEEVFVNSKAYGQHLRKAPAAGSRREEPAFKEQFTRTRVLNKLASEINKAITAYYSRFKRPDLYQRIQQRFRREPEDNRFLLLQQLRGMEINEGYPLSALGQCYVLTAAAKTTINCNLHTIAHPPPGKHRANCYYNELMLVTWTTTNKPPTVTRQLSDWVAMNKDLPEFEFSFPRPAGTLHWLLCLRQCLGDNERETDTRATEGIQIIEAGSFDKKEQALLLARAAAKEEKRKKERLPKPKEEVVRVKAKKRI